MAQSRNSHPHKVNRFDLSPFKASPLYPQALAEAIRMENQAVVSTAKVHSVRFAVKCQTVFGEVVKVVGSERELGEWNPSNGLRLSWSEGNVWVAEIESRVGCVMEFKIVIVTTGGGLNWEKGENHRFEVTGNGERCEGKIRHTVTLEWRT